MRKIKTIQNFASILFLLVFTQLGAQTNCVLQIGSNAAATVCPGTPIVLTATTSAINVGTGVTGSLNVTGTYYTDAVRTAVVGTNTTGAANNKVRVASTSSLTSGDEVIVICMQDPNTNLSANLAGKYDFAVISSVAGDTLRFVSSLTNTYNTTGGIKYQVIEIPHFTNVNIANGGVMTCNAWNGTTGGVLCFRANGTVNINTGGSIHANGMGYRGVAQKTAMWNNANGGQGEGILGTGIGSSANNSGQCNNNASWNNANANGGGGGTGCGDSGGGGGGGYGATGSTGVNWGHTPGTGGNAVGNASLTTWIMGGAGGEGGADEDGAFNGAGGNGGGIVYVATNSLVINGVIASNGNNGNNASNGSPGGGCGTTAGGGGAGGSVILETVGYSGSGSNVSVAAGSGGFSTGGCNGVSQTGGNGSIGRIRFVTSGTGISTSPTAYTVSAPALSGLTYSWSTSATTQTISVNPTTNTIYTVTITGGSGCVGTIKTFTQSVFAIPAITVASSPSICANTTATYALTGGLTTYSINGTSAAASSTLAPTSNAVYTVSGTSSNGCAATSVQFSVNVVALPTLAIAGSTAACNGQPVTFTASGGSGYNWSVGGTNSTVTVTPSSNFTLTLNGTNAQGCAGAAQQMAVTVFSTPVLGISGTNTVCSGSSVVLTGSGASTYTWSNGGNANTNNVSPTSSTTYTLNGTSTQGCAGVPSTYAVTVYTLPVLSITGTNSLCVGSSVVLTGNGATTYSWSTAQSGSSISVSPAVNTTYSLTGLSSNGCSGNTAVVTVTANPLPTVTVSGTTLICQGQVSTLTASGANTYAWSGGPSNAVYTVSPSATTNYSVVGVSAAGCSNTAVRSVSVQPSISVNVTGANTLCAGQTITLTANGATSYTWNTSANTTTLAVTPSASTSYSFVGVNGVCTATAITNITVNPNPTVAITGTTGLCIGSTATLTAAGATTYSWSNTASTASVAVSPTANAVYSVTGSFSTGCSNTATTAITVFSLPVVTISGNTFICVGNTAVLQASGAASYVWNTSATTSSINLTPTVTSNYTATGTSSNGCVSSAVKTITVNPLPNIVVGGNTPICAGKTSTVTASGASTYSWNTGANGNSITITPTVLSGYVQFSVSATSTANCINQKIDSLLVYPIPSLTIAGGSYVCNGNVLTLTVTGASTYTWDSGATTTTIAVTPTANTSYTAIGTSTDGCIGTAVNNVSVVAFPVVTISSFSAICMGDSLILTANGANTYTWNSGANGSLTVTHPTTSTSYTVVGEIGAGCADSAVTNVVVNALPTLVTTPSVITICLGETANLTVSGANTYTWSGGTTGASLAISPTVTSAYSVTGTSTDNCVSTASVNVTVDACTSVEKAERTNVLIYPNPSNGRYTIRLTGKASISVYNITGQLIQASVINNEGTVDLTGYSNGIYLVRIFQENGSELSRQLIKQ
jgi:hypothetical protein